MPFAGFLVSKGELSLPILIFVGAFGNLAGSLMAYGAGVLLEETVIISLIKKYGKFFLITIEDYEKSVKWLNKYGQGVSFFSRLLPAVRTFISLPAGLAKMNLFKFSLYTFFGSLIWSAFLAYVGFYLGKNWNSLEVYYRKFEIVIGALLIFAVIFFINHKLKFLKFPNKPNNPTLDSK